MKENVAKYGVVVWRVVVVIFLFGIAYGELIADRQAFRRDLVIVEKRADAITADLAEGNRQKQEIRERLVRIETRLSGIEHQLKLLNTWP